MRLLRPGISLSMLAILAACATDAQEKMAAIHDEWGAAKTESSSCVASVDTNPAYAQVARHLASDGGMPSVAQLSDEAYPTADEARTLLSMRDDMGRCRYMMLGHASSISSDLGAAFQAQFARSDIIFADLAERKMTWAQANRQLSESAQQASAEIRGAQHEVAAGLIAEHQAELAQRAAIIGAIGQGIQVGVETEQRQQLINAIAR